jgi:peptidoglycan/xylan/chitin deacetylase (PgdA/CDA1 family)
MRLREAPVTVLMYHSIRDPNGDPHQLAVAPQRFAEHVRLLASRVDVIRLSDLEARVRRPSVILTFDDGYADNLHSALPILEEFSVPATVFVTTDTLGKTMWWDRLAEVLLGRDEPAADLSIELAGRCARVRYEGPNRWTDAMWALYHWLKQLDPIEIDHALNLLDEQLPDRGTAVDVTRMMSEAELKTLASHDLIDVGAHTIHHERMAGRSRTDQVATVSGSKAYLEGLTGSPVSSFAYPFGGWPDVDDTSADAVAEVGIDLACTTVKGRVGWMYHPHWIPRQMVLDWEPQRFEEALTSWHVFR